MTPTQICAVQNISRANIPVTPSTPKTRSALEKKPSLASSRQQCICDHLCLWVSSQQCPDPASLDARTGSRFAAFSLEIFLSGWGQLSLTTADSKPLTAARGIR